MSELNYYIETSTSLYPRPNVNPPVPRRLREGLTSQDMYESGHVYYLELGWVHRSEAIPMSHINTYYEIFNKKGRKTARKWAKTFLPDVFLEEKKLSKWQRIRRWVMKKVIVPLFGSCYPGLKPKPRMSPEEEELLLPYQRAHAEVSQKIREEMMRKACEKHL